MIRFTDVFERWKETTGLNSQSKFAQAMGWSTGKVSQLLAGKYNSEEEAVREAMKKFWGENYNALSATEPFVPIRINPDVIVRTKDFNNVVNLCNGLLDPSSSLTASIGLVTGEAGRGKTTAVKRFAAENSNAQYILYMGYTRSALFRTIAEALVNRSYTSYYQNLNLIMECTRLYRKLIIIDEADRMPLSLLEDLRTLNESGLVPVLFVGEPKLASTCKKLDRIESRIRRPRIEFSKLDSITLATLYEEACGLRISKETADELLRLSDRDFRVAANDMQSIVNFMNINHIPVLDKAIIKEWRR